MEGYASRSCEYRASPAPDPVGQQQRIRAAQRLADDIDRALDKLMAGEPVDSKEAL